VVCSKPKKLTFQSVSKIVQGHEFDTVAMHFVRRCNAGIVKESVQAAISDKGRHRLDCGGNLFTIRDIEQDWLDFRRINIVLFGRFDELLSMFQFAHARKNGISSLGQCQGGMFSNPRMTLRDDNGIPVLHIEHFCGPSQLRGDHGGYQDSNQSESRKRQQHHDDDDEKKENVEQDCYV
jgi:hypothetical protein